MRDNKKEKPERMVHHRDVPLWSLLPLGSAISLIGSRKPAGSVLCVVRFMH